MNNRFPSFLTSFLLHAALLGFVLWGPLGTYEMPQLSTPMIAGMVTLGAPGKLVPGSIEEIPEAAKGTTDLPETPSTPAPSSAPEIAPPTPTPPQASAAKPQTKPETPPDAIPIPKKEVEKPQKADPAPDTSQKKPPKEETKKTPPEPKKTQPKEEAKKASDKDGKDKKKKDNDVDDALKALAKETTGTAKGTKKGKGAAAQGKGKEHSSVDDALTSLSRQIGGAGNDASGRGPGGRGGDGYGRRGTYAQSIISRIRPNWSYVSRADRKKLAATVTIAIDADGTILGAKLKNSSGDKLFDDMVINAIKRTRKLEPPQSPADQNITIRFTPEMGRR